MFPDPVRVHLLPEGGADPSLAVSAGPEKATPLHICSDNDFGADSALDARRVACARLLIAAGADLEVHDEAGRSALRFNVLAGDVRLPLTELLLSAGAASGTAGMRSTLRLTRLSCGYCSLVKRFAPLLLPGCRRRC